LKCRFYFLKNKNNLKCIGVGKIREMIKKFHKSKGQRFFFGENFWVEKKLKKKNKIKKYSHKNYCPLKNRWS